MKKLHRIYVKWRCFIGKGIDIWSKNPYPSNVLSNLHDNPFEFDGVKCGSMEGFLQSLKYKDAVKQKEVCAMAGKDAKNMTTTDWQANQIVWWQGREIDRQSDEFQKLILRAYKTMAVQNETFRTALISTHVKTLYHSKGCDNPYKTILTRDEFCGILMELRSIVGNLPFSREQNASLRGDEMPVATEHKTDSNPNTTPSEISIQAYFDKAVLSEEAGNLEEAYQCYLKAAEEGMPEAMFRLYDLFVNKGFHAKEVNNMLELALSGKPVMPWNVSSHTSPDVKSGLYWLSRAAELGHAEACCSYGYGLCNSGDVDNGLQFLKKSADKGNETASLWFSYFTKHDSVSDEQYYEALDRLFKTDGRIDIEIAGALKDGNSKQLAKYGYTLMTRFNNGTLDGGLLNVLMPKSDGMPYFPVAPKRGLWETFVRINKDALPDGTLLTFTSDIHIEPMSLQGLRVVGKAVYKSPSFGWLKDEKKAIVLQVDSTSVLGENELADVARRFRLRQDEYIPSNVAFFCENGEKEYSVEIAEIKNGSVNVMYRYTIDGSDDVHNFFTPELIELTINNTEII